jgi:hypothetical protein
VNEPWAIAAPLGGELRRLVLIALALPVGVVVIDQLLWELPGLFPYRRTGEWLFYPWLVAKTALVAWCAGKFLGPTLYGWIVFFWGQALVDVQTFHASVGLLGHNWDGLEHSLVAAQAGFLATWSVLGKTALRWRLTCVLLAAAVIAHHASSLRLNWRIDALPPLLAITAVILAACCFGLRALGFYIRPFEQPGKHRDYEDLQFGVKHMLIWTAALAPLLLVVRGFDLAVFRQFGRVDIFAAALICATTALVALATVWFVLGRRHLVLRAALLLTLIAGASVALYFKSMQLQSIYGEYPDPMAVGLAVRMRPLWTAWFALVSGLLAAMLLFLRESGFRLVRSKSR